MATAIIHGILSSGFAKASDINISDRDASKLGAFEKLGINIYTDNKKAAADCGLVLLAVKPNAVKSVMSDLSGVCDIENKLIVSIAAGTSTDALEKYIGKNVRIIRVMPNTPALVGEGMAALCKNSLATERDMKTAVDMFSTFGKAVEVAESKMDAVTAVSGSGPAYVYMFIEALADGGVLNGLPRDVAYTLAAQTVLGAAKTVLETGRHPGSLKDDVCSPGGTTIEAVASLERNSFRGSVIEAVNVCAEKSSKL